MEQQTALTAFHQHVVVLSLLLKGDQDALAGRLRNGSVPLETFAQFIARHRLQLFVWSQLQGSLLRQALPRQWLDQLKALSLKQWAAQERVMRELMQLSSLLTAAGHEFIVLKGPYIAARFFGSMDRREFSDLDILIRRDDLAAVERLLRNHGYGRKSNVLISRDLTAHFTHALDFAKPNLALDVHWLLSANAGHSLDYDAIWRHRQTFVLRNRNFFVLSDEYEVVFSLISIFKDLERGAARLKTFVDLYFILSALSSALNWEQFLENRRRERILQISVYVLALFLELFDCADRFPEVATAIAGKRQLFKRVSSDDLAALLEASPGALRNKQWAAGIYECSRLHVFLWWLVSLPFRLAVHDSGNYDRFKCWLQHATGIQRPTQNR
jgi:Uncharacterised nucleotidyltransferase